MKKTKGIMRNAHFLGTKIRNLRKRNNLTMEDLSARCITNHNTVAPSISYLSMIERGKRFPSAEMLAGIAQVFQKEVSWFLDDTPEEEAIRPVKGKRGGISGMSLEPKFLFANDILESVVPEMLSQTGVSGQQFAHLLIRAHQEQQQNHFPDLERAAEEVGHKQMPLSLEAVIDICKNMGLEIHWFDRLPDEIQEEMGGNSKNLVRSFFAPPNRIYINSILKLRPMRLKYDLAVQIGHRVLHGNESFKSISVAGGGSVLDNNSESENSLDAQDILNAWRDFECSFFASALLCPKVPFRQLLDRYNYEISVRHMVQVPASVVMRRMTAVSPDPHLQYVAAYPPGNHKAVYRGSGYRLRWSSMRVV